MRDYQKVPSDNGDQWGELGRHQTTHDDCPLAALYRNPGGRRLDQIDTQARAKQNCTSSVTDGQQPT